MHAFFSEVLDKGSLLIRKVPTYHDQISSHRSMREKLPYEGIAIEMSLRKQQDSRGKTINSMHSKDALPTAGEML